VYVSYQDSKFASEIAHFPVRWDTSEVDSIYLYDPLFMGYKTIGVPGSHTVYELAKFTTPKEEVLTRIGLSAIDSMTYLDIEVYDEFDGSEFSGLLASEYGFITEYAGYYTVDLPATVNGDFYVKVKRSIEGGNVPAQDTIFIPVEIFNEDYVNPVIEQNVNWYSSNGNLWFSTSEGANPFNLTIRAYTSDEARPRALFRANKTSACVESDVVFSFLENDPVTSWTWNFGKDASPTTATGQGPHTVSYASVGIKTISLIVDGAGGKDTLVKHDYVHITDHINVTVPEKVLNIPLGNSAEITAYGADSYIWTPSTTLSSGTDPTVTVTPTTEGEYELTLYGTQGDCAGYDYVTVIATNPPENDNMCEAILIAPIGEVGTFSNTNGTTEPGEPVPPGTNCITDSTWCNNEDGAVATIWFKFLGPASGLARFESGGNWDNQIAVYEADTCLELSNDDLIGANDDQSLTVYPAKLTVQVTPEQKYFLQVDGSGVTQEGTFTLYFYDDYGVGLEKQHEMADGLTVYPNPARDIYNVRLQDVSSGRIILSVYNVNGQLVRQGSFSDIGNEFFTRLNLADHPAGVYHLQLIDGERIMHRKIVKK
jgi:PKD repeat protein